MKTITCELQFLGVSEHINKVGIQQLFFSLKNELNRADLNETEKQSIKRTLQLILDTYPEELIR